VSATRKRFIGSGFAGVLLVAACPVMAQSLTFELDQSSSRAIGSGTLGTVTLTQNGLNEVDVAVALTASTFFVTTGAHTGFTFNLASAVASTAYNVTITSPTTGIFTTAGTNQSNPPYGTFTYGIDCGGCGPGASHKFPGPLEFTVRDASGIRTTDFNANSGGYFFSADVFGPNGGTGAIASRGPGTASGIDTVATISPGTASLANVPEPASLSILGAALGAIGVLRRRRRLPSGGGVAAVSDRRLPVGPARP
jgi:hypothetical protein